MMIARKTSTFPYLARARYRIYLASSSLLASHRTCFGVGSSAVDPRAAHTFSVSSVVVSSFVFSPLLIARTHYVGLRNHCDFLNLRVRSSFAQTCSLPPAVVSFRSVGRDSRSNNRMRDRDPVVCAKATFARNVLKSSFFSLSFDSCGLPVRTQL